MDHAYLKYDSSHTMANWTRLGKRGHVEDRRGVAPAAVGGVSLTGVLLFFLVSYLSGGDVTDVVNQLPVNQVAPQSYENTQEFA